MVLEKKPTYGKPFGVRLPKEVEIALEKKVKDKRKKFPRYTIQDAIRAYIVEGLKKREYLDKGKDYL
ncbi:MAG: hypothetical protein KC516_02505 [Nanoarchaeota archaeon]|nr:hypothetical protein [Nanoarchaeota archaeon]